MKISGWLPIEGVGSKIAINKGVGVPCILCFLFASARRCVGKNNTVPYLPDL